MLRSAKTQGAFWLAPAVGLVGGVAYLVAGWLGGRPALGAAMLAIMVAFSVALILLSRHSETVRGLLERRDERLVTIDLRATAAAGSATLIAVLAAAVVELARGHSGQPYTWLAAIGAVAYLIAVIVLRVRG